MSSMYIKGFIFSCDLVSLYPPVHFLSMWLSGIIAIININGDSASPRIIVLWIFVSAKLFLPVIYSTLQVFILFSIKFIIFSSDILHIFRQFIIQRCGTMSYAFLSSIQAIAQLLHLVLLSLRMC